MKIAVNQPYYYPYAGYFRLLAATDLFVIYDCCQWNRRGRVHRYQKGSVWVTLPIKKTDRDTTRIMDMQWRDDDEREFSPVEFICTTMHDTCERLGIPFKTIRSSSLNIDQNIKGQDRIIAICKKLGATTYVNSPGGKHLYDTSAFANNGVDLQFLPEYIGSYESIAVRLGKEKPEDIRAEIYANL